MFRLMRVSRYAIWAVCASTLLVACDSPPPRFEGEPPPLQDGRLAGYHLLVQWDGADRSGPHVIRTKEEAEKLAWDLYERLVDGANFQELARKYSDELETAHDGGDLGVFEPQQKIARVGRTLRRLHFGETSQPKESRFGYHIFQRRRIDMRHARQILIQYAGAHRAPEGITRTPDEARAQCEAIRSRVTDAASFKALAREESDGEESANGGDLGWLVRGETVAAFDSTLFSLDVGAISPVVESPYGFHLIYRVE